MSKFGFKSVVFTIIMVAVFSFLPPFEAALADEYSTTKTVNLPILMYHSILNSKSGVYIVSAAQLEADLKSLCENGYVFVSAKEVIAYANGVVDLPQKPIMLTFDDGHFNNLYYGLSLFEKYDAKAVFNIIGAFSDYSTNSGDSANPNYSHLTWNEIAALSKSGRVEFGNHTYNLHKYKPRFGVGRLYGELDEDYIKAISGDVSKLQQKLFETTGETPRVFAYPFGKTSKLCQQQLLVMNFNLILTCYKGVSVIEFGNPQSITFLKRINRSGKYDSQKVLSLVS